MKTEALLTPHMIASLKPRPKEYTVYDASCSGLALRIQPKGARSWVCWEQLDGKTRRVTLGRLEVMTLDEARETMRLRQAGVTVNTMPETRLTFGQLVKLFLQAKEGVYTPRTLNCLRCYLDTQLLPAFGRLRLHQIDTPAVAGWFYQYSRSRGGGANAALIHFTTIWNWGARMSMSPRSCQTPPSRCGKTRARREVVCSTRPI